MDLHDEWIYSSRKYINFENGKTLYSIYRESGLDLNFYELAHILKALYDSICKEV